MSREMKNSGIEWIGRIPKTWEVKAGKYCLTLLKRIPSSDDQVVTCFRDGEVTLRSERREEGFTISEKEIGYQGVKKGDLVVHGMDGFAGAIGISKFDGKGSPILNVLDSYSNKQFLAYYLRAAAFKGYFLATATGIRVRSCDLRWPKLAKMPILLPPLAAQQAIADYLDSKCSQIDQLTDNIKQQIASLSEYKKALITQAVTKGLDPDVEMKDSGIEWIEEIPVSWVIKKLNAFYSRIAIKNHPNERVLSVYREYGVIPKDSRSDNHNVTSENTSAYLLVRPTNLVVNKMKAWQGSMGISNHKGIVSPAYFVYQETAMPRERRFFHYLLRSSIYAQEFKRLSSGMREGQWDLPAYDFERTPIIVPPLLEQQQIAAFLDTKCSQIDALIQTKNEMLDMLQDYKKSLIFDYVTGKREVPTLYRKDGCHE